VTTTDPQSTAHPQHTFTAYLEDRPGVLGRVSALFLRRNFNIVSLTVGRSGVKGISRLTVVVEAEPAAARLVEANLYKLVNVLRVEDVTSVATVSHELALIKVRKRDEQLLRLLATAGARIVDETQGALIIENTGSQTDNDGLIERLTPFGVLEVVRTGVAALKRGLAVLNDQPHFVNAQVPDQALPHPPNQQGKPQ
jgi:acetolactate synthase-1/3 small subunit